VITTEIRTFKKIIAFDLYIGEMKVDLHIDVEEVITVSLL
jgi:hypothetical protein